MEIGVFTFADVRTDPVSGEQIGPQRRPRELLEEAELADEVGLDVFGVGEHHRPDFAVSAPAAVVLAAIAARTTRIRLTSAVTVLSSDDPVRVLGRLGLPMALAIIGGMPERFAPVAELHRRPLCEPEIARRTRTARAEPAERGTE